jgi:hypothetical protein
VLINNAGVWQCGTILPVANGIATCGISGCAISACVPTFGNCDADATNGCESPLNTNLHCGACGNVCGPEQICSANSCVTSPNAPGAVVLAANPSTGVTLNNVPVTLTATVSPVSQGGSIANGTVVTFNVSGSGGSLSSVTATTNNGVASVILNSSLAGSIGVSASAGASAVVTSNTVSVPFIAQPTLAIVKIKTTGTLANGVLIGGVQAVLTANPSTGLSIAASANGTSADVAASGVGIGSTILTNTNDVVSIKPGLLNVGGMPVGEFQTITYHIANGTFPTAGNFSIALAGSGVIDTNNNTLSPGINVAIASVTIQ